MLQQELMGLETYDLLGPFAVVEALQCLERIVQAAVDADLSWQELEGVAQQVMHQSWGTDGLPEVYLAPRRAEVLLRLDTIFEQLQVHRR